MLRPKDSDDLEKLRTVESSGYIVPLDNILGIDNLPFKMTREMMCEVAFWAQNQSSFKITETILKKIYGESVGATRIREVTDYVGKIVFEEDTREANQLYENLMNISFLKNKEGILYIQMDGATLNTRTKDKDGSTWRENKLGLVFSSNNIHTRVNKKGEKISRIMKKEYTSYVGSVDEFKKYLLACAVRNGYGEYKTTIVLGDGATWIRNMCEELFPDAIQILDLSHLCENTYEFAKALFKNDEAKYKPWAEDIIEKFKNSEISAIMKTLKLLKNRKLPKDTVNLYNYVSNNINKIDYKQYSEKGYYVGSGAIESGNKVVLQKRLKLAGMRWDEVTAQYLLTLRAKFESGLWLDCVTKRIISHPFDGSKG